uniref:Uncharacterized protein n=2 Tax=unclassified Streptomyces TaxID=2593676 RepID=V9QGH6_9ACTN|nr:hypothetical protein [Streptomyces sp. F11]AHC28153.1 hypothetical protein pFP12.10 [Streptomyces sp. F11]
MSPEALKRLRNLKEFWDPKMAAVDNDADLARVCFDRARAAAKRAQRGGNPRAMHELAELLAHFAHDLEVADAKRHAA